MRFAPRLCNNSAWFAHCDVDRFEKICEVKPLLIVAKSRRQSFMRRTHERRVRNSKRDLKYWLVIRVINIQPPIFSQQFGAAH